MLPAVAPSCRESGAGGGRREGRRRRGSALAALAALAALPGLPGLAPAGAVKLLRGSVTEQPLDVVSAL